MWEWLRKGVLPIVGMAFLLWMFECVYMVNGTLDWFRLWLIIGIPFGIVRCWIWFIPRGFDIGGTIGVLALGAILSGLIGGVIAAFTMFCAIWYLVSIPVRWMIYRSVTR